MANFLTCTFYGSGLKFGTTPYQEIFVSLRLVTLPSLIVFFIKNEQFCPLIAGLISRELEMCKCHTLCNRVVCMSLIKVHKRHASETDQ